MLARRPSSQWRARLEGRKGEEDDEEEEEEEEEEKKKKKQGKQTTLHVLPALSFPAAFNGIVARLRAPPGLPYLTAEWHS